MTLPRILGFVAVTLFVLNALSGICSAQPDIRQIQIDGKPFVAHPKGSVDYCPPGDVQYEARVAMEQIRCLEMLNDVVPQITKGQIDKCFRSPMLIKYFAQLQLMDVTKACLDDHVHSCGPRHDNNFYDELKELGLSDRFGLDDEIAACRDIAFPPSGVY